MIKLLRENHGKVLTTDEKAQKVLDYIKTIVFEDKIKSFIQEDLNITNEKKHAFIWFFDPEEEDTVSSDYVDIEITQDMVGKKLCDIMLEGQENYKQIDDMYLTWWM